MQSQLFGGRLGGSDDVYLPADATLLDRLRGALRGFRALEKSQDDPVGAALVAASIDGDRFERQVARLAQTEAGRGLLAERPALNQASLDLDGLGRYDEGTVGRAFAHIFEGNVIRPFESPYEVRTDADSLVKWYRETHDLHHIVTGYDTDPVGEMELQAFLLGNLGFRHNAFFVLMTAIVRPAGIAPVWTYWDRLLAAFRRGKRTRSLLSVRYDRYFTETVETLRADLAVPAR